MRARKAIFKFSKSRPHRVKKNIIPRKQKHKNELGKSNWLGLRAPLRLDGFDLGLPLNTMRTTVTLRREDFVDDLTFNAFLSQALPRKKYQEPLSGGVDITNVQQGKFFISWDEDNLQAQPQIEHGIEKN